MIHLDSHQALLKYRLPDSESAKAGLAFVPTMGNFHPGHLELFERALDMAENVVVSIYVNPTQFNQREDYIRYPRTLAGDLAKLAKYDRLIVFTPSDADIYPRGIAMDCNINPPYVANILEGEFRLGHFTGVATVVAKLLNLVQPQLLILGKKDYQQLRVLEQMVTELCYPCKIYGAQTVRESSGLAYSSRNSRLSDSIRQHTAPILYQQLQRIAEQLPSSGWDDFKSLSAKAQTHLTQAGFTVEYLQLKTQKYLQDVTPQTTVAVILVAAWVGQVRLIDSIEVDLT